MSDQAKIATPYRPAGASAEAIQRHYDVGNDFYGLWLDRSMTYSCALWNGDEDLQEAQRNKIRWHLSHAGNIENGRILDIGCGWGGLVSHATEAFGVEKAVGLSLSAAQVNWCNALSLPKIECRLENWADHVPGQPYNAVISIGAFEHFAKLEYTQEEKIDAYRAFFHFCHQNLVDDGHLCLQTITYENSNKQQFSSFFSDEVFPESDLPHLEEIVRSAHLYFEIVTLRADRAHYERTAQAWLRRLRRNRAEANKVAGEAVVERYEKYLGMLSIGFHLGTMNLIRIAMRRKSNVFMA